MFANYEPHTSRAARLAVAAAVVAGVGLLAMGGWVGVSMLRPAAGSTADPVPVGEPLDPPAAPQALVFVSGAVVHPGLYRLSPTSRIADAIAAAGGFTADADIGRLPDLAARVHDGRQVNVPFARGRGAGAFGVGGRLDLNSASAADLAAVPGMPLGLPEAIVEYRALWGPFASLSQLRSDLGLDAATVSALGHYLRVVPPAP